MRPPFGLCPDLTNVVTALAVVTRRGNRTFLRGFLLAGIPAVLFYWIGSWIAPWQILFLMQIPVDALIFNTWFDFVPGQELAMKEGSVMARLVFDVICYSAILTLHALPVLLIAMAGGLWAKRHAARLPLHEARTGHAQ